MVKKKRGKRKLSTATRARLARQARINFGLTRSRSSKRGKTKLVKRRKTRRKMGGLVKPAAVLVGGGIYGGLRARLSNALAPITSKVPLGTISDEVGLFLVGWLAQRNIKNKIVRDVSMAAMTVEAARIGEAVAEGSVIGAASGSGAGMSSAFQTLG